MEPKLKTEWLIGEITPNLPRGELPTLADILRKYFFNNSVLRMSTSSSRLNVARELIMIWKNLNTNCVEEKDVVKRMKTSIELYESYKKSRYRRTETQVNNEMKLEILLNYRFDIAPAINYHRNKHLKSKQKPKLSISKRKDKENEKYVELNSSSDEEMNLDKIDSTFDVNDTDYETSLSAYQKSKFSDINEAEPDSAIVKKILDSSDVFSTLDRTDTSSGKFTRICASILRAIGIDLNECVFSMSTVQRRRIVRRESITTIIKDDFLSDIKSSLVVHWDGKRLTDTTNEDKNYRKTKVERLAVVVCGPDTQKIITIAKTENGKGFVIADVVYYHLEDWKITENIFAICTDTTSANTGITNGAIVLFEENMKRNLLYLACRHHVYELIIGAVFEKLFGETTGPSKSLFETFKNDWWKVNQKKFKPLPKSLFKNKYMRELRDEVVNYIENILLVKDRKFILRSDYKEMLQLCLLVLGKNVENHTFSVPKNCSNARWMEVVIYALKIFLFRDQLVLTPEQLRELPNFCLFATLIYTKAWIKCCIASNAPCNDLELLKEIRRYEKINLDISVCAINKFREHLWYLGSELVVLALFSEKVEDEVKRRMFENMRALNNGQWVERNRRLLLYDPDAFEDIFEKELDDLVDSSSMTVLFSLNVDVKFMLENDVSEWRNLDSYNTAKNIVDSFKVVNDVAERSLKLMTDVNGSLTNDEGEKQKAIQVIEDNRKRVPTTQKSILSTYKRL